MNKLTRNSGELRRKAKRLLKIMAIGGSALFFSCGEKAVQQKLQKTNKIEQVRKKEPPQNAVKDVVYQVDTLKKSRSGVLLYHSNNKIVRYFVDKNNSYRLRLYLLAHEQKHKDNYNRGLKIWNVSPSQYAKICMHDEISANICALLTLRYEYLATKDKEAVINKYKNGEYGYYFQAIKDKQIFPEKNDTINRDKEWSFIANETQKMWMATYFPNYMRSTIRMVERYMGRISRGISPVQQNKGYQKAVKIAYNIGGVDFGSYMKQDITINDNRLEIMDGINRIDFLGNGQDQIYKNVNIQINKLKIQQKPINENLVRHIYYAEWLKFLFKDISADEIKNNPQIVDFCYKKIGATLNSSKNKARFEKLIDDNLKEHQLFIMKEQAIDKKTIEQIYTYKNVNLSQMITSFTFDNSVLNHQWQDFENKSYTFPIEDRMYEYFIEPELKEMRKNSKTPVLIKGQQSPKTLTSLNKSRRSEEQRIAVPDFTQPILTRATPQQIQEIYQCIEDFNNIPEVLKNCDVEQQKKYLLRQKQREI